MLFASTYHIIASLLVVATAPECQAQSYTHTVRAKLAAPLASELSDASPLTFCREGRRLLAIINRDLLETDFVLRAPAATAALFADDVNDLVNRDPAPLSATSLANRALRLQRTGDSIVLLEYSGTVHGQLQYRRRCVMPILSVTAEQRLIVDAAALGAIAGQSISGPDLAGAQLQVVRLPPEPMLPRFYDARVRFINTGEYIYRWRLEKKSPTAQVSDVVQPIVFRLSESVPPMWVPHVKRSIEKWNPLFEAIGFRHAIVVRLAADTPSTDREVMVLWDNKDAGQIGGATTPNPDPRTGELLGGTIIIHERFMAREGRNSLLRGELDPRTPLPLADSLGPLLLDDVVIHEVGHALGLEHNFKGSGVYPTDSLRRPSFLHRMGGTSTSVMAYAAGNYVAQPEDGVTFLDRRAGIGPYDRWTISWGYRQIPTAATAEAERPILEQWRSVQDTAPYLQSSLEHSGIDPTDQPFTGGDDPVKSSDYGLRNLTRLVASLDPKRDTVVESHPRPFYIAKSWNYRMTIAASVVGGVTPQRPYPADLANLRLLPVDSAKQIHAMQFVLAHTFYGQDRLISEYVLGIVPPSRPPSIVLFDSVTYGWYAEQWRGYQKTLLTQLVEHVADPLLSKHVGLQKALCQELAVLKGRLSTAASSQSPSSGHAKELYDAVAPAFAVNGSCH